MAKLTLSFKERKLKVFTLPETDCTVGRDPDCDIVIDSLAIEPRHARILFTDGLYSVEPVSGDCTLSIGDEALAELRTLNEGDRLYIGKHCLAFSAQDDSPAAATVPATVTTLPPTSWLQIQSGQHLGRTIRLNKAFTRVGRPEEDLAVIAHRGDGYYLSNLYGEQGAQINGKSLDDHTRRLQNGDRLTIGELQLQFFSDGVAAQASSVPPAQQSEARQRQFSRIPFQVDATLWHDDRQWQTTLIDISLHGALLRAPASFQAAEGGHYRLDIHLEGGPDICMDVEVAHREDGRLGLRCAHIDVESVTHLRRLVELNLGDPGLLERELSALG